MHLSASTASEQLLNVYNARFSKKDSFVPKIIDLDHHCKTTGGACISRDPAALPEFSYYCAVSGWLASHQPQVSVTDDLEVTLKKKKCLCWWKSPCGQKYHIVFPLSQETSSSHFFFSKYWHQSIKLIY